MARLLPSPRRLLDGTSVHVFCRSSHPAARRSARAVAPPLAQAEAPDVSRAEALRALDRAEAALSGSGRRRAPGPLRRKPSAAARRPSPCATSPSRCRALTGAERRRAASSSPGRRDPDPATTSARRRTPRRSATRTSASTGPQGAERDRSRSRTAATSIRSWRRRTRLYAVENGSLGWRDAQARRTRGSRAGERRRGADRRLHRRPRPTACTASPRRIPVRTGARRSSYLVIDNDYAGFSGAPVELMRATVAHEYNHILQFAYDTFEQVWMFESTATWMEEQVYPGRRRLPQLPAARSRRRRRSR